MSGENQRQNGLSLYENKTATPGTLAETHLPVTNNPNILNLWLYKPVPRPCGYVVDPGAKSPFCDRPALKGSSYCAFHHALCTLAPDSAAASRLKREQDRIAARFTPPPPEMAHLTSADLPISMEESDEERLAGIELARERAEPVDT